MPFDEVLKKIETSESRTILCNFIEVKILKLKNKFVVDVLSHCCQCSTEIVSNATNMCVACLREEVDISEGIPKQSSLYFCRNCERYVGPFLSVPLPPIIL